MLPLARVASRSLALVRQQHTATSPPQNRVGFAHKAVHMVLFAGSMLSVPIYICVNFKNYRGQA